MQFVISFPIERSKQMYKSVILESEAFIFLREHHFGARAMWTTVVKVIGVLDLLIGTNETKHIRNSKFVSMSHLYWGYSDQWSEVHLNSDDLSMTTLAVKRFDLFHFVAVICRRSDIRGSRPA